MNRVYQIAIVLLVTFVVGLSSCTKEEPVRIEPGDPGFDNPFDGINDSNGPAPVNIDPASFLGIYNDILSVKCGSNDGACHDGSFEPDYRTLFSAYNTLVLHTPTKNIVDEINGPDTIWVFPYRVTPGDPDLSWLHYRVTTNDENLGRMPLYDQALSEEEVNNIRQWIENGALDPFGNEPGLPSAEPQFFGVLAYENDVNGLRLDTTRANILEPMVFPQNTTVNMWFGAIDYTASGAIVFPPLPLEYSKIKISDQIFGFDDVSEVSMQIELFPHFGPSTLFGSDADLPYYHNHTINTADFEPGTIYYLRVYLQGALQDSPTEMPEDESQIYWHTYTSFVVE